MQGSKLYVGNLEYSVSKKQIEDLFAGYGQVTNVNLIEGKGFAFVELSSQAEAEKAQQALDGSNLNGRTLKVDEARPQRSSTPFRGNDRSNARRY